MPCADRHAALYEFDDVRVERHGRTLLAGATASVPAQGITAVVGPSGAGKSTLLRLCNRLEVASRGTVRYRGHDIRDSDPPALRREVGLVFQRPTALPGTVAANLRAGAPRATDGEVAGALAAVGLAGADDRPAHQLSGGEAQRMCVARTLLTRPRAVLLDEPTSNLDGASARVIEGLAAQLAASGTPVVWVTHELDQVRRLADHVMVVVDGRVAQAGDRDAVLGRPTAAVRRFLAGGDA